MTYHPNTPDSPASSPELTPTPTTIRHDGWTPQRQRAFCELLADSGNVNRAAQSVGMTRESAYRLRQRESGRAFALAWDAALLLARQCLIDDAFDMAFEGSVERHYRDGKLVMEKRRRDPKSVLATIERLGSNSALGSAPAKAIAQDFEVFLNCMEVDAHHQSGETAHFMEMCANREVFSTKASLSAARNQLTRAMRPRLADRNG